MRCRSRALAPSPHQLHPVSQFSLANTAPVRGHRPRPVLLIAVLNGMFGRVQGSVCALLVLAVLAAGCTSSAQETGSASGSPGRSATGSGVAALDGLQVEVPGSSMQVRIVAGAVPAAATDRLRELSEIADVRASVPAEVTVNGALPDGGAVLTRRYRDPVPAGSAPPSSTSIACWTSGGPRPARYPPTAGR